MSASASAELAVWLLRAATCSGQGRLHRIASCGEGPHHLMRALGAPPLWVVVQVGELQAEYRQLLHRHEALLGAAAAAAAAGGGGAGAA